MNPLHSLSLARRVALVTGSTTGLGKSIALALGRAGAKVALNYQNNAERAAQAFAEYQAAGCEGALFRGDVTSESEVPALVASVAEKVGPIDILVLNATGDQPMRPIEEYDWAFCQRMIDFFVKSPFLLAQACLPHMKARRWGRIINIGSEVFSRGTPNFTAYVAAKGGQNGLHRSLANEAGPWGITVNMISPGWVPVERHAHEPQEAKDGYRSTVPLGRLGVPDDIAAATVFLASDSASFITGQNIHLNGGLTVQ
jgi:3-oxoacyl-[acyl-carrier protein] reductase